MDTGEAVLELGIRLETQIICIWKFRSKTSLLKLNVNRDIPTGLANDKLIFLSGFFFI